MVAPTGTQDASQGTCNLCKGTFSKAAMGKHLRACRREKAGRVKPGDTRRPRSTKVLDLLVEGHGLPQYWLHLEARADAPLGALDDFLRRTWLECCDHMSEFRIQNKSYSVSEEGYRVLGAGEDLDEEAEDAPSDMDVALGDVLRPRMKFFHDYDFGTTTRLVLRVISVRDGDAKGGPIRLLARNDPPMIPCESCGKPATQVCTECLCQGGGWLCAPCAGKHDCAEEMFLPVVNSPRVGMCGYTGA
jgi:hypothetical protein